MLYIETKKYKKRIFLKVLRIKEDYLNTGVNKIDITDII